jgi:hypothetical protein
MTSTLAVHSSPSTDLSVEHAGRKGLQVVWHVALFLLAAQLLGMLVLSTMQYGRFNLTADFATYSHAWYGIAHGQLDPYSAVLRVMFWRNDLELLMWPLALLYWVWPHAVALLWLQDLAVVGGELVVVGWVRENVSKDGESGLEPLLLGLVTALVILMPWGWFTSGMDFHTEPFAALFGVLAARALLSGRHRCLLLWVPLTLACCAVPGALIIIAVGLASLIGGRKQRAAAVATLLAACAWLISAMAMGGTHFGGMMTMAQMYGYLVGHTGGQLGALGIVGGILAHPLRALDMLRSHAGYVASYVASGGVIGLVSRWGLLPATAVLLPSALNAGGIIGFEAAFQSWPAVLFLVVGSSFVLQHLVRSSCAPRRVLALFGGCAVALAVGVFAAEIGQVPLSVERVSLAAASKLTLVSQQMPIGAEVIASQGIIGRFGPGHGAYPYWATGTPERFPLLGNDRSVVFVLTPVEGTAEGYPEETRRAVHYVEAQIKAAVLEQGAGIWAFLWYPPVGTSSVVLP